MKRTILLFILSVLISSTLQAQQTLPYHSYSDFNGNVAAYLKYNFEYRSRVYSGKTFAQMMNDMEIQPLGYIAIFQFPTNINPSILLYFNEKRRKTVAFTILRLYSNNFSHHKFLCVLFIFKSFLHKPIWRKTKCLISLGKGL